MNISCVVAGQFGSLDAVVVSSAGPLAAGPVCICTDGDVPLVSFMFVADPAPVGVVGNGVVVGTAGVERRPMYLSLPSLSLIG